MPVQKAIFSETIIIILGWKSEILVDISDFFLYIFHEKLVISY